MVVTTGHRDFIATGYPCIIEQLGNCAVHISAFLEYGSEVAGYADLTQGDADEEEYDEAAEYIDDE
ncbi:MAG: hypothetical protein JW925_10505, partial [Syntrophaceae bacterium]|nr:hypothetical protein [Syntrophaceae bacterium]